MNKNLFENFNSYFSKKKALSKEKHQLKKIKEGLRNDEFKMHLQFIVDNKTKKIASAEALSRWELSSGEVIFPGAYIGLMEKFGLIVEFDYYMFEKVCKKLSEWTETEYSDITVSCNITRITISEKDFVSKIKKIADKYDFDRKKFIIEITEDTIEKNLDVARENIKEIKELGFSIALDDVGSGYTSFLSLGEYPIDIAKIDRKVLLLTEKERGKKLFLGIMSLMHKLNLEIVCEGVETEEQNALVTDSECDYIQGWYYSKALPEHKAEVFLKEYTGSF